jgi:hypothetical protein
MIPLCLAFAAGAVASAEPTAAIIFLALALWRQRRYRRRQELIYAESPTPPAPVRQSRFVIAFERSR